VIEDTYWERAHELHGIPTRKAQRRLGALNEAYEVLASPHRREEYDRRFSREAEMATAASSRGWLAAVVSLLGKPFRPD
jgi:DnaJ-class molecular chaperone